MTLDEVKNRVSQNLADKDWDELMNRDYEYAIGLSKMYSIDDLWEMVAKLYAKECCETFKENLWSGFNDEEVRTQIREAEIKIL